ncbi:MAG: hypothetical protein FMNOHCHN_00539 [Ignavibacteriaceae bacterium]|nr:hypothetical protein [Ignavibacteriaceae bacterium]
MKFDRFEETVRFEKIRRRKASASYSEEEYQEQAAAQIPGSIHPVEDRFVHFDLEKRSAYKPGGRPGAITSRPSKETRWQSRWVPFSTRMKNRNAAEVVFLRSPEDNVSEDCVALPFFSQSFHCKTPGPRIAKLPDAKLDEILSIERGMYDAE